MNINYVTCCGIKELHGLNAVNGVVPPILTNAVEKEIEGIARLRGAHYNAYMFFSDVAGNKGGPRLKEYIEKNGLGEVVTMPTRRNFNSGNDITMWIWVVDHEAFDQWTKKRLGFDPRNELHEWRG